MQWLSALALELPQSYTKLSIWYFSCCFPFALLNFPACCFPCHFMCLLPPGTSPCTWSLVTLLYGDCPQWHVAAGDWFPSIQSWPPLTFMCAMCMSVAHNSSIHNGPIAHVEPADGVCLHRSCHNNSSIHHWAGGDGHTHGAGSGNSSYRDTETGWLTICRQCF